MPDPDLESLVQAVMVARRALQDARRNTEQADSRARNARALEEAARDALGAALEAAATAMGFT